MKLSSLLAIAGGVVGLAAGGDTASQIASGAAIVSGVAGATGNSNVAKIAGIASLGAGAYSAFGGGDPATNVSTKDAATSDFSRTPDMATVDASISGGASGTGQSFSDARTASQDGTDYNGGLPGASNTPAPSAGATAVTAPTSPVTTTAIAPGAATTPGSTGIQTAPSLFDSAKSALSNTGQFLDKNKELVKLAGGALDGAFGAGAKQNSLLEQRLKMQQAQIDLANANSNNLVGLSTGIAPNPNVVVRRTPVG